MLPIGVNNIQEDNKFYENSVEQMQLNNSMHSIGQE